MTTLQKIMKPLLMAVIATVCLNFTSVAQNMVTNPGFEDWTDGKPDGWIGEKTQPNVSIVQSSTAHDGTSSCQLVNSGSTHQRFTSKGLNVVAGQEYKVTFWLRGGGDVRTGFWDGQGSDGTNFAYNAYISATGTWTQQTQTVTAPVTAANAELIFSVRNTTGDNILIDDVEMLGGGAISLKADFKADMTVAGVGATINFTDLSTGGPLAWEWNISGPETKTSTAQNPSFTFTKAGTYDVKLKVSNDEETSIETKADYISIGDFLLFQDFNSGSFGNWETISIIGDQKWIISSNGGPDGTPCAQMNGYSGGNNANEDWLVSPEISAASFILSFDNAKNFNGENLKLLVSEDYSGNVANATWNELQYIASAGDYKWVNSGEIKYTPKRGTVHIAFKYVSSTSAGALWRVDNIMVKNAGSQSIGENENAVVKIYPNPTNGALRVENGELRVENIRIFDVMGRLVANETQNPLGVASTLRLDISHLPSGVYFLQITMENGVITQKIIKQ